MISKSKHILFTFLCLAFMLGTSAFAQKNTNKAAISASKKAEANKPVATTKPIEINWLTFPQALELNKKEPRKWIIDVYTDWCGWCKVMDRTTFKDTAVAGIISKYFYAVKFNAETKDTFYVGDKVFINTSKDGERGAHQMASALLNNKLSYPTTVYLDENLGMLGPVPGYLKPEDITPILLFYGQNIYKHQGWEDYKKSITK